MAKTVDKTNLGYLGVEFQYKLAKCIVEDVTFFPENSNIIDQNAFTESLLRTFVGTVRDYYNKENTVPSYDIILMALRRKANSEIEIEEWEALVKKLKNTSFEGFNLVKESASRFFKQQKLIKAANMILEKAGNGNIDQYDDCRKIFEDALMSGDEDDMGHSIYDLKDKALSNEYTVSIPTGIHALDDVLGGGLDKGKLGLMMAALGVGKTTYSTAISSYASTHKCDMNNHSGWKVLQIYFEDDDVDITRKHFSRLTNFEAKNLKRCNEAERAEIGDILEKHPDKELLKQNLKLLRLRTGEVTASQLERKILKLKNKGFNPDLVIIDYFECLAHEKSGEPNESEWTKEGKTMRKLENMAKDLNLAIWITSQGGRDSIVTDILTANKGSGSIKKQQIAQVIISVARDLAGQNNNSATLSVLKNRSGGSGHVFHNIIYDNGTSTISCTEVQQYDTLMEWKVEEAKLVEESRVSKVTECAAIARKNNENLSNLNNK